MRHSEATASCLAASKTFSRSRTAVVVHPMRRQCGVGGDGEHRAFDRAHRLRLAPLHCPS